LALPLTDSSAKLPVSDWIHVLSMAFTLPTLLKIFLGIIIRFFLSHICTYGPYLSVKMHYSSFCHKRQVYDEYFLHPRCSCLSSCALRGSSQRTKKNIQTAKFCCHNFIKNRPLFGGASSSAVNVEWSSGQTRRSLRRTLWDVSHSGSLPECTLANAPTATVQLSSFPYWLIW